MALDPDRERPPSDPALLERQLTAMQTGGNVHTIRKAIAYLHDEWRDVRPEFRELMGRVHREACEDAVDLGGPEGVALLRKRMDMLRLF